MSIEVQISSRGAVSDDVRQMAAEKLGELERVVRAPLTDARLVLSLDANPRIPEPAHADAEIRVDGRPVRASVKAASLEAAVYRVVETLGANVRRHVDRIIDHHHEPAQKR